MKKKLVTIILALTMTAGLSACGSPDSKPSGADASSAASSGTEEASSSASGEAAGGEVDPSALTVAVSLGWLENEAGMRQKQGYEETFQELGISDYSFVDANYDPVLQSQQIESIIQAKPDLLFITPSDPNGITEAVQHAVDAGIPVFCSDGTVNGVDGIISQCVIDNYSGGYATMSYLAEKMGGKGNVGMIYLDSNESWHKRDLAALDVIEKYPDIHIVAEWSWDSTGVITPRMGVDDMLAANPNAGDIDAIWAAWDGGCFEGIQACQAAGRTEIIFAGFDGGEEACNMIINDPQFVVCNAPCIYNQGRTVVLNAIDYLNGKEVEPLIYADNAVLTEEDLSPIELEDGEKIYDYDKPGMLEKWGITKAPTVEQP